MLGHSWLVSWVFVSLMLPASGRAGEPAPVEAEPIYQGKTVAEWISDLNDPKCQIQRTAAQSLAVFGPKKEVVSALATALKTEENGVVVSAAQTLGKFGSRAKAALPELRGAYKRLCAGPPPLPAGKKHSKEYLNTFDDAHRAVAEALILIDDHPGPELASILLGALKTDDADKRRDIVRKLGKLGAAAALITVPALIAVLNDTEDAVHWASKGYRSASVSRDYADSTKKPLTNGDLLAIRLEAIKSLGRIGPAAKPALHALTLAMKLAAPAKSAAVLQAQVADKPAGSDRAGIRVISFTLATGDKVMLAACAEALGRIRSEAKGTVGALSLALRDLDEDVRWAALCALLESGQDTKEFAPILLNFLHDKDAALRRVAVEVLAKSGAERKPILPAFTAALKDKDASVRESAAKALGGLRTKGKQAVPSLLDTLKDTEKGVRAAAAEALGKMSAADKEVIQALITALGDKEKDVFRAAAMALGNIGPQAEAALPRLLALLQETDAENRALTCLVLGSIGPAAKQAIAPLDKIARNNGTEYVRLGAYTALAKIDSSRLKDTLPRLTEALRSDKSDVIEVAAICLMLLGRDARDALPKLRQLRDQTSDTGFKEVIDRVMKRIQHPSKNAFDW